MGFQPQASCASSPQRPRVIVADDHRMVADAFSTRLAGTYEIVGVAYDGDETLALIRGTEADCLLLDLIMPKTNGLELIPAVRVLQPRIRILVVTMLLERELAQAALKAGANGFVPKDATLDELETAINEVLAGRQYLSSRLPKTSHRLGVAAADPSLSKLTPRQQEILLRLGEGGSETEIARQLGLSLSTVAFHKRNLMRNLGIATNAGLVRLAVLFRSGLAAGSPES